MNYEDLPNYYDYCPAPVMTKTLEAMFFAASRKISNEVAMELALGDASVEFFTDYMTKSIVMDFKKRFWGEKRDFDLPPRPVTWWDHFKRDAIPTITRVFKLRVNETKETLRAATLYPDTKAIPGGRFYYLETHPTAKLEDEN